jgi:hypothetical protein
MEQKDKDEIITLLISITNKSIQKADEIEGSINSCWGKLVMSESNEGMAVISEIFSGVDALINNITALGQYLELEIDTMSILNIFSEIEKAMKIQDYVLLADLLYYEIKPKINLWKNELKTLVA